MVNIQSPDAESTFYRSRVFARILIVLGLVVIMLFWVLVPSVQSNIAATIFGGVLIGSGVAILLTKTAAKAHMITRITIIIATCLIALAEIFSQETIGVAWLFYLIWPPMALLILRDVGSFKFVTILSTILLIGIPLVGLLQLLPITLIVPAPVLWIYWIVTCAIFATLNTMIFFIWRDEQKARTETNQTMTALNSAYADVQERNQRISEALERQQLLQSQVEELQVPLIKLGHNVELLPLIGTLDAQRLHHTLAVVPAELHERRVNHLVVDLTGGSFVDPDHLRYIDALVQTTRLLGIRTTITGISAELARTIAAHSESALLEHSGRLEQLIVPV